ncbi:MAG: REP-associated tyrosine transposase [Candidatus Acidiferrales bacterium]
MPKQLKRIYGFGHLHFLTFSCYHRLPLLGSAQARNVFVQVLGKVREEYGFKLVGYVVMPEHVHLLISEPARGTPSTVIKMLKQRVSHRLGRQLVPSRTLPQFWQRRFYDFNVWSRKKAIEKLAYMHANPIKRGLVDDPKDWGWSSYAFYQGRREVMIEIDPVD